MSKSPITAEIARPLADLAQDIRVSHRAAHQFGRSALEHARQAGDALIQAKGQLPHGQWLPWLAEACELSPRTAQSYMAIARRWPQLEPALNTPRAADLPIRQALALLVGSGQSDNDTAITAALGARHEQIQTEIAFLGRVLDRPDLAFSDLTVIRTRAGELADTAACLGMDAKRGLGKLADRLAMRCGEDVAAWALADPDGLVAYLSRG